MKKNPFAFIIIVLLFFSSCSENNSEKAPKENGFRLIVSVSYSDFLSYKMSQQGYFRLLEVIQKSERDRFEEGKDFWESFENELILANTEIRLALIMTNDHLRKKYKKLSNKEVIKELQNEFDMEFSRCMVVTENRLKNLGATYIEVKRTGYDLFEITAYNIKDKNRFSSIIQQHARVGFFETMENTTVLSEILRLTKIVHKRDSIAGIPLSDSYLDGNSNTFIPRGFIFNIVLNNGQQYISNGAQIGMAKWSDTTFFNQFARDTIVTSHLPKSVHFLWGWKDDENGFPLYTIKSNNFNRPELSAEHISDVRVNIDNGNVQINITFNLDGAEKFRKLTQKNVDKTIAIVIDRKVISAPNVLQEISGGAAVISGNFTVDEAEDLVNVLKAGNLPVRMQIISMEAIK